MFDRVPGSSAPGGPTVGTTSILDEQGSDTRDKTSTARTLSRGLHSAPVGISTSRGFATKSSSTCALLKPAGQLSGHDSIVPGASDSDSDDHTNKIDPPESDYFIPQIVHEGGVGRRKRVLVLCTGGTLTSEFWSL